MSNSRNRFAAVGLVILVGAFALSIPSTGRSAPPSPTANVNVVNTADKPIPTLAQGTTAIAGNVGINGMPTVNLAAGTSVGITSATDNPVFVRSVDDAVRELFQEQVAINLADGEIGNTAFLNVPVGKRLVIEHVSAGAIIPAGQKLQISLSTIVNNTHQVGQSVQVTHFLVPEKLGVGDPSSTGGGGGSIEIFHVSQPMRIYADADPANVSIVFAAGRGVSTGSGSVSITISGYYVDVQ